MWMQDIVRLGDGYEKDQSEPDEPNRYRDENKPWVPTFYRKPT
jgi:hypothetical protein